MINNNWIFGFNSGLDFSTNPPTPTSSNLIGTYEGCASISDKNGNLLFYTDGQTIWDNANFSKATGLLGDSSSTQSAIIVPDPSNSDQYYVLTMDGSSNSAPPFNHFNGGLYNVITGSFIKLSTLMTLPSTNGFSPAEKITAIQHKNCKDYWVLTILQKGNDGNTTGSGISKGIGTFRIFKINSSGIQHHIDIPIDIEIDEVGYLKSSNNLQNIVIANGRNNNVLVYPFDNSTGLINISGLKLVKSKYGVYGVEFSPNSNLLYYGTLSPGNGTGTGYIYQVDFLNNLTSTKVGTFRNKGGRYAIGALQLGIDNRIYIAKDGEKYLGAIENPDILGTGCNVNNNFITLPKDSKCMLGLPNLLPNACVDDCGCGCTGCNKDSDKQNEELISRAKVKFNTIKSNGNCADPFTGKCELNAIEKGKDLTPCFSFHWGDGNNDQIEEHDTEIFYITICNNFNDITFNGLRITKVTLTPNVHPVEKIQIVPDRFVNLDCLKPCSCQTREFAMITRANDTAGNYTLEVEYCYEEIVIALSGSSSVAKFPVTITED